MCLETVSRPETGLENSNSSTRTIKKRRTVPTNRIFLEKWRRTVPYCHSCFWLLAILNDLNHYPINQLSQFTHLASVSAVFCVCIQKAGAMCEKSGVFSSKSVPTYRTRTFTKKAYRTRTITKKRTVLLGKNCSVPYHTYVPYRTAILACEKNLQSHVRLLQIPK